MVWICFVFLLESPFFFLSAPSSSSLHRYIHTYRQTDIHYLFIKLHHKNYTHFFFLSFFLSHLYLNLYIFHETQQIIGILLHNIFFLFPFFFHSSLPYSFWSRFCFCKFIYFCVNIKLQF